MGTIDVLTDKIKREGQKDIEKILLDAQTRIDQRRKELNKKEKRWEKETLEFIEGQKIEIRRQYEMSHTMEKRRIESKEREEIVSRMEVLLKQKLYENIGNSDYPKIILGWIVEAAIGLNEEQGIVNTSEKEKSFISDKLLKDAEKKIKEEAGLTVTLTCAKGAPLSEQGLIVSSKDKRVSYNNKISTRLKRYRGAILDIITDGFF